MRSGPPSSSVSRSLAADPERHGDCRRHVRPRAERVFVEVVAARAADEVVPREEPDVEVDEVEAPAELVLDRVEPGDAVGAKSGVDAEGLPDPCGRGRVDTRRRRSDRRRRSSQPWQVEAEDDREHQEGRCNRRDDPHPTAAAPNIRVHRRRGVVCRDSSAIIHCRRSHPAGVLVSARPPASPTSTERSGGLWRGAAGTRALLTVSGIATAGAGSGDAFAAGSARRQRLRPRRRLTTAPSTRTPSSCSRATASESSTMFFVEASTTIRSWRHHPEQRSRLGRTLDRTTQGRSERRCVDDDRGVRVALPHDVRGRGAVRRR